MESRRPARSFDYLWPNNTHDNEDEDDGLWTEEKSSKQAAPLSLFLPPTSLPAVSEQEEQANAAADENDQNSKQNSGKTCHHNNGKSNNKHSDNDDHNVEKDSFQHSKEDYLTDVNWPPPHDVVPTMKGPCPECGKHTLRRCLIQEDFALLMCIDVSCVYPFGDQSMMRDNIVAVCQNEILEHARQRMLEVGIRERVARKIVRAG
ncbi:uncharacterized protein V1518DRAFT_408202 [Limtongia smithiae]|uniref:uncharacterized protein n=1 Tax=Limtongia smithiae TaxID=1125753 RepID=UPI0034CFB1CF